MIRNTLTFIIFSIDQAFDEAFDNLEARGKKVAAPGVTFENKPAEFLLFRILDSGS